MRGAAAAGVAEEETGEAEVEPGSEDVVDAGGAQPGPQKARAQPEPWKARAQPGPQRARA